MMANRHTAENDGRRWVKTKKDNRLMDGVNRAQIGSQPEDTQPGYFSSGRDNCHIAEHIEPVHRLPSSDL